jgi:uncharacterized protein Smg (DUF494 family)
MAERWTRMLATLREQFSSDSDVGELESFLASKGLDRQEIGEVLRLYRTDVQADPESANDDGRVVRSPLTPSLRVQGPHERGRFTADAWGYLLMLYESGVVASFDFEQLVERALFHVDGRIDLPEIRALADEVGLDATPLGTDRTLLH